MKKNDKDFEEQINHNQNEKKDSNSEYFNANQAQGNDPHADRSAKSERKGAGQDQNSSAGPINS